ncbi:sel1 repeat family protein [Avibacterium volantium]|uniref:SEL1-like repeat protein n=1 Tax=Avibacterium TaxID=292486 RepID=UPI0039FD692C
MKHACLKIFWFIAIAVPVSFVLLIKYLECNPIFMGGGPSYRPERCTAKEKAQQKENAMQKMEQLAALEFSCVHEERPPIPEEIQQLYNYALYQDLHKMWTGKAGDWNELLPYYRIAAANGDYKANVRLQYLLETNRALTSKSYDEVHSLNKLLAKSLPATAYYKLYGHLDIGFGVTTKEKDGKYAYLRKAADLGSREAQYVVAEMLENIEDENESKEVFQYRLKLAEQLLQCASEQGLGAASKSLALGFKIDKRYSEAVRAFHQGVKNGSSSSAHRLAYGFDGKRKNDGEDIDFLNLPEDIERSVRYKMIQNYLSTKDYLQPKVPDLDEIVPLPPAKLPPWDGKIAFQRWFEGPSPEKPSDELMQKLAEKAGLDWQTGLSLKK